MIFSSFLQWASFYFACWLEKAPQKYISISVSAHQDWDASEAKEKANYSPRVFPGNGALTGTCEAQKYRRESTPELPTNYHLYHFSSSIANITFLCPEFSWTTKTGKTWGKSKESPSYLICPQEQHLCVCLSSSSPCPAVLRVGAHESAGTYWTGTAEKAQPTSGVGQMQTVQTRSLLVQISESMFPSPVNNESLDVTWEKMRLQRMYK